MKGRTPDLEESGEKFMVVRTVTAGIAESKSNTNTSQLQGFNTTAVHVLEHDVVP